MKIAVIADPHANFPALQAVAEHVSSWQPDRVIVAGDLVNRGPRPLECLEFILQQQRTAGWLLLHGNHEDYVIDQAAAHASGNGPSSEVHRASYWTFQQLGGDVAALEEMPFQHSLSDYTGRELRFLHASMTSNRDGIYPESSESEVKSKLQLDLQQPCLPPVVVCVGHTHRPFVRESNGLLLVNAGSAGLPFDGNSSPAYARLYFQNGAWKASTNNLGYKMDSQSPPRGSSIIRMKGHGYGWGTDPNESDTVYIVNNDFLNHGGMNFIAGWAAGIVRKNKFGHTYGSQWDGSMDTNAAYRLENWPSIDSNTYWSLGQAPYLYWYIEDGTTWNCQDLATWQSNSGKDSGSSLTVGLSEPTGWAQRTYIYPIKYESGRAHVFLFNGLENDTVKFLPTTLTNGQTYYLYNMQNLFGDSCLSETWNTGDSISVPMDTVRWTTQDPPYGHPKTLPTTFPAFGGFLLVTQQIAGALPAGQGGGEPPPTTHRKRLLTKSKRF